MQLRPRTSVDFRPTPVGVRTAHRSLRLSSCERPVPRAIPSLACSWGVQPPTRHSQFKHPRRLPVARSSGQGILCYRSSRFPLFSDVALPYVCEGHRGFLVAAVGRAVASAGLPPLCVT